MSPTKLKITEKEFQTQVVELAQRMGQLDYHTHDSRRSAPGFPDLVLCKPERKVIFIELKTESGKPTNHQLLWIGALRSAGADARLWRPRHFDSCEIQEALR